MSSEREYRLKAARSPLAADEELREARGIGRSEMAERLVDGGDVRRRILQRRQVLRREGRRAV